MKKYILLVFVIGALIGCTEKTLEPVVTDNEAPGTISEPKVTNIGGGAIINYVPPGDKDLAYVKAVFERNGIELNTRSSKYTNELRIEGLSNDEPQDVKIFSVDKSENSSSPVSVTIEPKTPPFLKIFNSITISEDFGGAKFDWINDDEVPVFINLLIEDTTGMFKSQDIYYSTTKEGTKALRGYDPEPTKFAAIVGDRYDNYSDTIIKTVTPLFEQKFDKSKWKFVLLENDHNWSGWGTKVENVWDDDIKTMNHTYAGSGWPQSFTFDFGELKKLSRMKIWQRQDIETFIYTHGNPEIFKIYGRVEKPSPDGDWSEWVLLKECKIEKPSGLPLGNYNNEDLAEAKDGHEFLFDVTTTPEVRYIRFQATKTWDGASYCSFGELSFFGQSKTLN